MRTISLLLILTIFSFIHLPAQVNFAENLIDSEPNILFLPIDLNGDGAKDFVTEQSWLRNDGNNNFTRFSLGIEDVRQYGDVDKDGDIDLLGVGNNFPKEIVWLENDGLGNFIEHLVGYIDAGILEGFLNDIYTRDIDGDGDMDIVTATVTEVFIGTSVTVIQGSTVWWENNGFIFTAHDVDAGRNVYPEDIDGDGDIDLATASKIANPIFQNATYRIDWQENLGNGNFETHNLQTTIDNFIGFTLHVTDIGADGDMDIVTNRFSWWENDGNNIFSGKTISGEPVDVINSADIDGDGDMDLLTSGIAVAWWEYKNHEFLKHVIHGKLANSIVGDDFDEDGDIDIIASVAFEGGSWWENDPACHDDKPGFTLLGEFDNHKYFLSNDFQPWEEASAIAANNGGYLASINSEGENTFLYTQMGTKIVHIGFNDATSEGTSAWNSGEVVGFDMHDGANSEENDYGVLNFWDGSWTLVNGFVYKRFIMEVPCGSITPTSTLTCRDPITIKVDPGETGAVVYFDEPIVSSNCGTIVINQTSGPISGSTFPLGITIIEYEATLTCGTDVVVETCSFTIKIEEIGVNCTDDIAGFTYWGEYNDHKYFLSDEIHTHEVAASIAATNGAYMASIDDQGENDFLQSQLNFNIVHIGLSDAASEGTFAWDSGNPVTFNNHDGNNSLDDNFGVLNFWDGSWTLMNKWVQKQFIMEVPCGGTTPSFLSISCPSDIIVTEENSEGGAVVFFGDVQISTNCDDTGMALISGLPSGSFFPVGTTVNTYEVIAFCGTDFITKTCSFSVTVEPEPVATTLFTVCSGPQYVDLPFPQTHIPIFYVVAPGTLFTCSLGGTISHEVIVGPPVGTVVPEGAYHIVIETTLVCGTEILKETCDFEVLVGIGAAPGESISVLTNGEKPKIPKGNKLETLSLGTIFPNPADREVTLSIYSQEDQNTQVEVFDAFGKRVLLQQTSLYKGDNQLTLDITKFMAGIFTVKIGGTKERAVVSRFVKILD